MTPVSNSTYATDIPEIAARVERAVGASFAFLEERGYNRCPAQTSSMDDLRDAMISLRYACDRRAVDIHFSFLTFQIQVVLMEFPSAATCDRKQRHADALDIEAWISAHSLCSPPKLPWMKTNTLLEEMTRSYNKYAKQIQEHMEAAMDFLADRLRNTGLLDSTIHTPKSNP